MIFMFIFGGLAIIVTGVTVDPLALRRRLSPGLPLSLQQEMISKNKRACCFTGSPESINLQELIQSLGGLAIIVTGVTVDPLALRRRLSPGLPLSDF